MTKGVFQKECKKLNQRIPTDAQERMHVQGAIRLYRERGGKAVAMHWDGNGNGRRIPWFVYPHDMQAVSWSSIIADLPKPEVEGEDAR